MSNSVVSKTVRYHPVLVALHWLTFILIFATFFIRGGDGGEGGRASVSLIPNFPDLGLHMILGIAVLLLLLIRLVVRWRARRPDWASTGNSFLDKIGELTHWALYLFTFGMVITGLILSLQDNRLARTFGIGGALSGPGGGGNPLFILGRLHGLIWIVLFLLIALHVGAALYHQFLVKDNLMGRMWFGRQTE